MSTPIELTDEQMTICITLAAEGKSLRKIIDALCINETQFLRARQDDPYFAQVFEDARQEGLEHHADSLLDIANEEQDVQRGRLKSDNIKWLLSKRKPRTYGDRVDVNVTQTVDMASAMREAQERVLIPPAAQHAILDAVNNITHPKPDQQDDE